MYPPHTLEVGAGSRLGAHNEMPSKVAVQQPRAPVRLGTAVPSHSYSKGLYMYMYCMYWHMYMYVCMYVCMYLCMYI